MIPITTSSRRSSPDPAAASNPKQLPDPRPLAHEIAAATRSVHAELNKLIIARLPLALPPQTPDPSAYVTGLLHIAPVYITFETLWQEILSNPPKQGSDDGVPAPNEDSPCTSEDDDESVDSIQDDWCRSRPPQACDRVHSLLQHLCLPDLLRTNALKQDIGSLTGWDSQVVEEQLKAVSETGRLGEFVSHIQRAVRHRPHVILAYSYIMFMALFAGGRLIRSFLESVGDDFWDTTPSPIKPMLRPCEDKVILEKSNNHRVESCDLAEEFQSLPGYGKRFKFLRFATPMDGEDLKLEFKSRLIEMEKNLTPREKRDIVKEAVSIFDNMRLVVKQLDVTCTGADQGDEEDRGDSSLKAFNGMLNSRLSNRFRDSVAVTKARALRTSSRISSSQDEREPSIPKATADLPSQPRPSDFHARDRIDTADGRVQLCPAMSKSMRFDTALPQPSRSLTPLNNSISGESVLSRSFAGVHITNVVVVAAFSAVIICALLTGHRGMVDAL